MHAPLGTDRIAERTGDRRRSVGAAEGFERALATVGHRKFDAVVAQLPTRRPDSRCDLGTGRCSLELVDRCHHSHGRSLGFDAMGIANDIASLDATAQAELVRNGSVSADELVEAAIEAAQRVNPPINAIIHPRYRGSRRERHAAASGPFAGVPMVVKDLGCMMKGEPYHLGFAGFEVGRLPRTGRLGVVPQVPRSRLRGHRPNERPGDGEHHHDRAAGLWPVAQSVEPRPLHRRVVGRLRSRGRSGHRCRRSRQRRRRLDSRTGLGVRTGRSEAEQGPGQPGPVDR